MFVAQQGVRRVAVGCTISSIAFLLLVCCSALQDSSVPVENVADDVFTRDLTARFPQAALKRPPEHPAPNSQIYPADPENAAGETQPTAEGAVARGTDSFDLNFQNADINAVTKVLLGDLMKVTYSVDPRVQGTVSLTSGRPVAKADLLPLFESTLKLVNAHLVYEGKIYKVVPTGEALGNGVVDKSADGRVTPGYGISVMPLKYVSAQMVLRAIDSFAAKPGTAKVEPSRNLLLVQGPSTERASAIEAALALDVDWMRNQAVGIFPVRNASPETIITELRNVFDTGNEGAAANLVRFQPVNRLNAVLAVGQTNAMINQVRTWVARLDRADYDNATVRVYRVRYGNARLLAAILRDVFTGQSSSSLSSDLSQLTPGSGVQRAANAGMQGRTQPGSPPSTATFFGGNNTDNSNNEAGNTGNQQQGGRGAKPSVDISSLSNTTGSGGPGILPNVRITADVATNSLLIYASRDQYKIIERAIYELDQAPMQVAIDVTVAEITLKDQLQYGVQFYLQDIQNGVQKGSIGFGLTNVLKRTIPGANFVLGSNADPRVVLNALKAITDVRVISSPAIVVLDNQTATLQVGDQVPITTQSATDVTTVGAPLVNTIQMTDTGVILKVTPRVNANGVVNLDVTQEVSQVQPQTNTGGTSTDQSGTQTLTPTISKRKVQSTIAVASGQTVLLAGLISSQDTKDKQGIPILSDLKGIGDLFATNNKTNNRTELIMFIRPQIIRNGVDAQLVAEELRSKLSVIAKEASAPHNKPTPTNFVPGLLKN
ncbi:MAG: type II secretion system secretin GspD [Pseudolabrys sp.]|jgi:general secretion pathway protein D